MPNTSIEGFTGSRILIVLAVVLTGSAGFAAWLARGPRSEAAEAAATLKTLEGPGVGAVPSPRRGQNPSAEVTPDPRFIRRAQPSLPAALPLEARQMALAIQNKYRCAHCCDEETTPRCLPGLGKEAVRDPQALTDALRKSLGELPDDCYVSTALPRMVDPKTPAELMNTLYEDLLKRPNPIKLRMLFIIAEIDGHPLAARGLTDLRAIMQLDHQNDWPRWEQAVVQQCAREERGMRGASCRVH